MTAGTAASSDGAVTGRRDAWRREIAQVLDVPVAALGDDARLVDDLALDSLAMMSLLGWLDSRGIRAAGPHALRRVGDILALLEHLPAGGGVSIVIRGAGTAPDPSAPWRPDEFRSARPPTPEAGYSPLAPVLGNQTYRLTPLSSGDVDFLYALAVHPANGYRWRYRGVPPSPDRFGAELWGQVLVQYVVRTHATGEPVGLVVAYSADLAQGHASVAAVFLPEHAGTGLAADITALFVRYLFHTFRLRKLYLEIPGFNWPQLRSGAGRQFQVEGVLRDHDFYAGRFWNKYLCAIYPTDADADSHSAADPSVARPSVPSERSST